MKTALDFLIIGAQKAGTTSLFEYLRRHPELHLPPGKEAPFFSHDIAMSRGWDRYLQENFAFADPSTQWGTATPHYMAGSVYPSDAPPSEEYDEWTVPQRIQAQLPDVRLIAILRDPAERAISHHRMMHLRGEETRSVDQMVAELLRPEELEHARRLPDPTTGYIVWGEYGRILDGYMKVFPRDRLEVIFTSELERDPETVLTRLHDFLGVSTEFLPPNLGKRYREGAALQRTNKLTPENGRELARRISIIRGLWTGLPPSARYRVHQGFERVNYAFGLWNRRTLTDVAKPSPATVAQLKDHFAGDSSFLASSLELSPPWSSQELQT